MNTRQLNRLQTITNAIHQHEKDLNGAFEFDIRKTEGGSYILFACNTSNSEWFMPHNYVCVVIGKRGGAKVTTKSFNVWYL